MRKTSPELLSKYLGQAHGPTRQQSAIIGDQPGPLLVVAGAGAGKTETMAARVVWLVANGLAEPDQILGLTFTRKAAQELGRRIRNRLETLAGIEAIRDIDPSGKLAESLTTIAPTVSTYDAYAGQLIREHGLLVPVEPAGRLITKADLYAIAHQVVTDYRGVLTAGQSVGSVTENLISLIDEMNNQVMTPEQIASETQDFLRLLEDMPKGPKQRVQDYTGTVQGWINKQKVRLDYLPLVEQLRAELSSRGMITFNEQMSVAARLASEHPQVGASQRRRYRVVMLDEYQDTSHSQRVLLASLFGTSEEGLTVTAVGDPMQSIYGWRGATAENLAAFVDDFPAGAAPAPKRELTISWRNPPEILTLANAVSTQVLGSGSGRAVAELEPKPEAAPGTVSLGFYADPADEIAFVADTLAREFQAKKHQGEVFTGAVLLRKNRHAIDIAQALAEREIPYEIVGRGGLLQVPEVADIVALATMLIRPQDTPAALRILSGPLVGLGLQDLIALGARARNLAGRSARIEHPEQPLERLQSQLAELTAGPPDQVVGLTDAIADLGERSRYSEEGVHRLELLSARLRRLRTNSLGKSLSDLFADIENTFGVRTEVLARGDSAGAVHLDRLADVVAGYFGDSLEGLLDFFQLAEEHEDGLAPGEVVVRSDRVQILTAHKAKGLEWDVVCVLHADSGTYRATASTFLTNETRVPDPEFDATAAEDRKEFEDLAKGTKASKSAEATPGYLGERREAEAQEATRLFYVAITRSERVLTVTGSRLNAKSEPYVHLAELAELAPESVITWEEGLGEAGAEEEDLAQQPDSGRFPNLQASPAALDGAALVRAAMVEPATASAGETFEFWEAETSALIEEHVALSAPVVEVELPGELTATDLVALRADPAQFARRQRRPVPFKPNTYAKRGTEFHLWLEEHFGGGALLDENQLPGIDEEVVNSEELETLKKAFVDSPWHSRTPAFVEEPFEVSLGDVVVRGRMDAIFRDPDDPTGWIIVDWKTGRTPTGPDRRAAIIQLAVYREAWSRIIGTGESVRAAFHYVAAGETLEPKDLPDHAELVALLESSTHANR
ncbi:ATP-dependent helicase [Corynebacterium alimapuense]|uniref:DNA 3'-5' helicase n=1 Tax=Corynebacterium alimapuense TaxID=1576874 RepID=A0A3M8K689_9CORY|nr:UvrD-helicase domain-containing protein [Corynebacterium alimapuense]RNE48731.1 DNA helicase II [Corynebacterium alimapuense]